MFRNPLEEQGGEGVVCNARTTSFPKKKRSLRALRAHNERTYTSGTSCAGTRRVPFVGCSSSGSQNMGDGSGGDNGGEECRPNGACPRDDQSSPHHRWTHRLSDALFSFRPREERLAAFCPLLASLHSRGSPKRGGQNQNRWGPQVGGNATSPLHSRGSPKRGGQNQNRWGPQVGGNATSPLHSRGSPKRGGQNQNRWGPQVGDNATSPRGTKSELDA